MEKNLKVPYHSQWDDDAKLSKNDCGAASVRMILNYYGEEGLTTDQIQTDTGAGSGLVRVDQIQKAIIALGYTSEFYTNQDFQNIKNFIDRDTPVIALVHYGSLISRQDQNFKGGHFMPIVGYREDNGVYANDPNFNGATRDQGDHHNYTSAEFLDAWGNCAQDGNPNNTFLVINRKVVLDGKTPSRVIVTDPIGVRGRVQPVLNSQNIAQVFPAGTELEVLDRVTGDSAKNVNIWYQVKASPNPLYIWSGAVAPVPAADSPKPQEPVVIVAPDANVQAPVTDDYLKGILSVYQLTKDILVSHNALPDQKVEDKGKGFLQTIKDILHIK